MEERKNIFRFSDLPLKTQKYLKYISVFIGILIFIFVSALSYFILTYIDDKISSGSGYGFKIGSNKKEALESALPYYEQSNGLIYVYTDDISTVSFPLARDSLKNLIKYDRWEVLFGNSSRDYIELEFKENKISRIIRRRQNFELP